MALDREIEDLVGPDRSRVVEAHLAQNAKNVEHRTEARISRARQRLAQFQAGTLPARIEAEWRSSPEPTADHPYYAAAKCPACGQMGHLEGSEGSDVESFEYVYDLEDGSPVGALARINVPAEYFGCSTCHLVLDDYELIEQAGLPDSFEFVDENPEWPEPDYGND
jgi:hypothetical protein